MELEITGHDYGNPLAAVFEEEEPKNELREFALARMDRFWLRGLRLLFQYDGNKLMALDAFALAIGQGKLTGLKSAVAVAEKHFKDASKKAAVSKVIKMFQDNMEIEPMPGQRSLEGAKKMSQARKNQLKKKNP